MHIPEIMTIIYLYRIESNLLVVNRYGGVLSKRNHGHMYYVDYILQANYKFVLPKTCFQPQNLLWPLDKIIQELNV